MTPGNTASPPQPAGLPPMRLVRGGLPLYRQLANVIQAMAKDGVAGDTVMTEHELCRRFGVSRTTVRQALQGLAAQGLVVRLQGKGTTLVRPRAGEKGTLWEFGNLEDMVPYGRSTAYTLTEHGPTKAPVAVAEALGVQPGALVHRFVGARSMNGTPFVAIETWLPYQIAAQVLPHLDEASPVALLVQDRLGIHVTDVDQTFTASSVSRRIAEQVGLKRGKAALVIRRLYHDAEGTPVALSINYCNPDQFEYRVRLKRRGHA